jgi:hypothetical protein
MNGQEIIEMARQAGAASGKPTPDAPEIVFTQCLDIYLFAKLVAAKEREACAKVCEGLKKKEQAHWSAYGFDGSYYSASDCATAIRARA